MSSQTNANIQTLSDQLDKEKRAVAYDQFDISVRQLLDMASGGVINIAPEFQRHFVWDNDRESELIESIFLGIPVPSLYMATNKDGTWEVVDGVQRLSTLLHFCGDQSKLSALERPTPLKLTNLRKLDQFNGNHFLDLPQNIQLSFHLRSLRVITLNDKSDFNVRYDLFERLNTGGVVLHPQEIRNCVFRGPFRDKIKEIALNPNFVRVVKIPSKGSQSAIYEECVLRFFSYLENYENFDHSVIDFLNEYMIKNANRSPSAALLTLFNDTFSWLDSELPGGIARGQKNITSLTLFEAVAVGTALAKVIRPQLPTGILHTFMNSDQLRRLTTGGTNSRTMVTGRINFIRDSLLS